MSTKRVLEAMVASLLADCVRKLVSETNNWYQKKKNSISDDNKDGTKKETAQVDLKDTASGGKEEDFVEKMCKCYQDQARKNESGRKGGKHGMATVAEK